MVPGRLPPLLRSITGKATVRNTSPTTITSESLKWMTLSPSVCEAGTGKMCTSSPFRCTVTSSL